jgi:hypothetical protein
MNKLEEFLDVNRHIYSSREKDIMREKMALMVQHMKADKPPHVPADKVWRWRYERLVEDYVKLLGMSENVARSEASKVAEKWINMENDR